MKKQSKSNLDEMKELELLHIERNGCWIAFWGLFTVQAVQFAMSGGALNRELAGEWIVFMILSLYLAVACLRKGIWDRHLKPNFTTNLIVSLLAGAVCAVMFFVKSYYNYGSLSGSIATAIFSFVFYSALCLGVLSITAALFKSRKNRMENEEKDS